MKPSPLSQSEVVSRLSSLDFWKLDKGAIVRTFGFANFRDAMAFVNKVAELAEVAGHHPDIDIRYNKVKFALVTHDSGGLTANDFDLAAKINRAA